MPKYHPKYPIALFACYFIHFMIGFAVSGLEVSIVPVTSGYVHWNIAKNSLIFVGIGEKKLRI